jgi:hypothetical protein
MSKREKMALRKKRDEMAAFDALGPLTRRVVSEAPCMLDARKISDSAGIPIDQLGLYDEELSASIAWMIEQEYGRVL